MVLMVHNEWLFLSCSKMLTTLKRTLAGTVVVVVVFVVFVLLFLSLLLVIYLFIIIGIIVVIMIVIINDIFLSFSLCLSFFHSSTLSYFFFVSTDTRNDDILAATDINDNQCVVKILRPSDRVPYNIHRIEMEQEKNTCQILSLHEPSVALCKVEVIDVTYESRKYIALKMPRF